MYPAVVDCNPTGQIYTDLTGRFPVQSSKGNKYVFVLYDYDSNAILSEALKNRTDTEILRAYTKLHSDLVARGLRPQLQKLDNEASKILKNFMAKEDIDFQLVPPHVHRRNAAERAIRTFKNHMIAGLCSTDPNFPMHLWCRLLEQGTMTLCMLRASRINPSLSAFTQLWGNFDFNRTPLAPPGTKVIAHEKPSVRNTWAPHGVDGWYIGPSREHYRCYHVYIPSTRGERDVDTIEFFPTQTKMPQLSSSDAAIAAAQDLVHALQNPAPAAPFTNIGDQQIAALKQLADIFQNATATKKEPPARVEQPAPAPPARVAPEEPPTNPVGPPRVPPNAPTRVTPPAEPPRVVIQPVPSPRVPATLPEEPKQHRYPTRIRSTAHLKPERANHIQHQATTGQTIKPQTIDSIPIVMDMANAVIDPDTGKTLGYRELMQGNKTKVKWNRSSANEFGRLAQGVGGRIKGTNTIFFIRKDEVPSNKTVTYARFVCDIRPQKEEQERVRMTVGGDRIEYPHDVSTKTADIVTAKILLNSTVSTHDARFMVMDAKNFYLGTPMPYHEFMRVHRSQIPQEIIDEYNLEQLFTADGWVYIRIEKGMYGLPQAGILANQLLQQRLAKHGYRPTKHTPGLWKHDYRPVTFCLVVDDFGVKYVGKEHADHLHRALLENYEISVDWDAKVYCGIHLKWNYKDHWVELSMPGYVQAVLHKHQHPEPKRKQYAPHKHNAPQYGAKIQLTEPPDLSPPLVPGEIKTIQQIVGSLLYYGRAIDSTILMAISDISAAQAKGTEATKNATLQLLDYCASNPDAKLRFYRSDMILHIHSDASYLTAPKARSRTGGHFFLANAPDGKTPIQHNGAILATAGILKSVMASAAESEVGAIFDNTRNGTVVRITLDEVGHPQPATPVQVDNSTATGIVNNTVKQQRSRAMDMRFYWVRDRIHQGQFYIYWAPGCNNLADYYTKHHSPAHHRRMRPYYVHMPTSPTELVSATPVSLRGCVDSPNPNPSGSRHGTHIDSQTDISHGLAYSIRDTGTPYLAYLVTKLHQSMLQSKPKLIT